MSKRESTMSKLHERHGGPGSGSSISTTSPRSTEEIAAALEAIVQNQEKIARSQTDVVSVVSQLRIELEQTQRLMKQSTSLKSPDASGKKLDEILESQATQGKAIALMAETLTQTEAIKLPSGETVTRSELDALQLSRSTNEQLKTVTSSLNELTAETKKRHVVRLDEEKVIERLSRNLDASMRERDKRLEALFSGYEEQLASIGADQTDLMAAHLAEATKRLDRFEERVGSLQRVITWQGVGRVALALVPFAVVALVLAGALDLLGTAFGVGPLLGWAWSSFEAASLWWHKALIAVGTLGGASLAVWLVVRLGKKVSDAYRGW